MSIAAVEQLVRDYSTTNRVTAYDKTKINLDSFFKKNTGIALCDHWVGPFASEVARPMENSVAIPAAWIAVTSKNSNVDYVFYADGAAAAATRRIGLYEFDRTTWVWNWKGFITLTPVNTTTHTVRAMDVDLQRYITGTASCSAGTAVTGSGTQWATVGRIAGGARIGFGSTDPDAITTWYTLSPTAVPTDTAITLSAAGPNTGGSVPYVIEELRIAIVNTNATATNGGIYLAKGLNIGLFIDTGTTIAAASATDQVRAVYWLKDAATQTNTTANGCAWGGTISGTTRDFYVGDGASTAQVIFKYNLRAPLTVASGASVNAFVLKTGSQAVTGTISQNFNAVVETPHHGPGAEVEAYFFTTTSRVYRVPLINITSGSTTFIADTMVEVPPGGATTQNAPNVMTTIEYEGELDKFIITPTGANGSRGYITEYWTDSRQFDRSFLGGLISSNQSTASPDQPLVPCTANTITMSWSNGGVQYILRTAATGSGITTFVNQIYAVPHGADQDLVAASDVLGVVMPAIQTPGAVSYRRLYWNTIQALGGQRLSHPLDYLRIFWRTTGIDDDSGTWSASPITDCGDMSGIAAASEIQFKITFRVAGVLMLPGRLIGLTLLYDADDSLPPEVDWNVGDSENATGIVGFYQTQLFSGSVPTFTINYYKRSDSSLVLTQASTGTTNGEFEYWTGAAWASGTGSNTVGTRRRFRPTAGLPSEDVFCKISAS